VANGAPVSRSHTFSRGAHKPHPKWTSFKIEALTAQTDLKPRHLDAWYEERSEHRSGFELRYAPAFPFWYVRLANGAEAFLANCELTLHIERPLRASGARLESRIATTQILEQDVAGKRLTLTASQPADPTRRYALAPSNALLTVAEANAVELFGNLKSATEIVSGSLAAGLPLFFITPTLPDAYAAYFDPRDNNQPSGDIRVTVSVIWTEPFAVEFDIRLDPPPFNMTGVFKAAWYARTSMMVSRSLAVLPVELMAKAFRLFSQALLPFRPDLLLPVANGCECEGDFLLP